MRESWYSMKKKVDKFETYHVAIHNFVMKFGSIFLLEIL